MKHLNRVINANKFFYQMISKLRAGYVSDSSSTSGYNKSFADSLSANHYLTLHNPSPQNCEDISQSEFTVGLLGCELLRNWKREWWDFTVGSNDGIQGLEYDKPVLPNKDESESIFDVLLEHPELNSTQTGRVAAILDVQRQEELRRKFVVALFNKQSQTGDEFDIHFEQLRFFKKFLNKPASLKQIFPSRHKEDSNLYSAVLYETETCKYCIQETRKYVLQQDDMHSEPIAATIMSVDTRQLLLATLIDGSNHRDGRRILKLHPALAPIKVVVLPENIPNCELNPDLVQLVEETCQMLRYQDISCWNGLTKNISLAYADEIGAPFSLILGNSVFSNGLLYMRRLTTTINMEIHMSDLVEKLVKYLKAY